MTAFTLGGSGAGAAMLGLFSPLALPNALPAQIVCVRDAYDMDDLSALATRSGERGESSADPGVTDDMLARIVTGAAQRCQTELGWSDQATFDAWLFETGRIMAAAASDHGVLAGATYASVERAYLDAPELRRVITIDMGMQLVGQPSGLDAAGEELLASLARQLALSTDEETIASLRRLFTAFEMQSLGAESFDGKKGQTP